MAEKKESFQTTDYAFHIPIRHNEEVCIGCNSCVEACMNDVQGPNPEMGKPPIMLHPDDCWYCGSCLMECPNREDGAIIFDWPMQSELRWKRKETGELFRIGMADPPAPNRTPPVGGWITLREPEN
jgi:NAD-dependent dihydropyrimidine dehydrogenase PreA subunit